MKTRKNDEGIMPLMSPQVYLLAVGIMAVVGIVLWIMGILLDAMGGAAFSVGVLVLFQIVPQIKGWASVIVGVTAIVFGIILIVM